MSLPNIEDLVEPSHDERARINHEEVVEIGDRPLFDGGHKLTGGLVYEYRNAGVSGEQDQHANQVGKRDPAHVRDPEKLADIPQPLPRESLRDFPFHRYISIGARSAL